MKVFSRWAPLMAIFGVVLLVACGGSSPAETSARPTPTNSPAIGSDGQPVRLTLDDHGGAREGHTPSYPTEPAHLFAFNNSIATYRVSVISSGVRVIPLVPG